MSFASTAGIVALTTLAVSYGWGMRGCKLGGEKGAMLPGAFLGLILAWFSGSEIIRENFWIITAVGALGMFYGGTETYGQTLGFIVNKKPCENYAKGMAGVLIKGALWFGICAAFLGIGFTAMTGAYYKWYDFVIFFAVLAPLRLLGIRIFNKPLKPAEKKSPKIYFSVDRQEEWGGLLFMLIALIVMMAVRKDTYSLMFCGAGAVSGAVGWAIGINLFKITCHPLNNGKLLLGSLQKKGYIGSWKIMEFTLGAVGGMGIALYYCLNFTKLKALTAIIETNGGIWNPLGKWTEPASWLAAALLLTTSFQYLFNSKAKKNKLKAKKYEMTSKVLEILEQPFYSYIPLLLILFGGVNMAQIITFFVMYWVIAEKDYFERFAETKARRLWFAVLIIGSAAILTGQILLKNGYSAWDTWLLYCVSYELTELCWMFRPEGIAEIKERRKSAPNYLRVLSEPMVHAYFVLQIAVLIIAGSLLFR
jgi:hypothetical protein